jgi:hypothetical protein
MYRILKLDIEKINNIASICNKKTIIAGRHILKRAFS